MKLSDLQEARYKGDHPILDLIKRAVDNRDYWQHTITDATFSEVSNLFNYHFGEPIADQRVEGGLHKRVWDLEPEALTLYHFPDGRLEIIVA